ncbi:hypothetical protein ACVWC1_11300, partial [Escherichia coli]
MISAPIPIAKKVIRQPKLVLAEEVVEIPNPRVALLNIGEEEVKGLDSIRDASAVLKTIPS